MVRLFEEHLIRKCTCLDGAWRMQADLCDVGESEQWELGLLGRHHPLGSG